MTAAPSSRLWLLPLMAILTGASAEPALPRLAGIVVGPEIREAIFVDRGSAHATVSIEEGGEIAGFKIVKILPDAILLAGPSGVARLELEQDANNLAWRAPEPAAPPGAPNVRAEVTKSGASIGMLALRRDSCARAGLLPDVAPDSELRLKRVIAAMSRPASADGSSDTHRAPAESLATALSAGLEDARQNFTLSDITEPTCVEWNASWRASAPRFGMP